MARYSGLSISTIRRVLNHAILNCQLFAEQPPGIIIHSPLTRALVEDKQLQDYVITTLYEFLPAGLKVSAAGIQIMLNWLNVQAAEALAEWPCSEESTQTASTLLQSRIICWQNQGYSLTNGGNASLWEILASHPERSSRFANAMSLSSKQVVQDVACLLNHYPWETKQTIVDLGRSLGSVSIQLAEKFPSIKCTVQDLPDVAEEGKSKLPQTLRDRVTFMAQ